jgi:aspartyl-tRNA(Asn)/glutamyl-tRNA(Gln) amidotransferase subunit A
VKDLLDVAGFPTRRGSRVTDASPAADDSPSVVGLKAAGAVIVGKTCTTEFGWKSPGDCPLHGITRNPWNPAYTPTLWKSGKTACQPRLRRFCFIHDPPRLPGQRIARRSD